MGVLVALGPAVSRPVVLTSSADSVRAKRFTTSYRPEDDVTCTNPER